jgi:starvation-inducible DNA-binding protein
MSSNVAIPENSRKKLIKSLNSLLSDGIDLHYQCKQAHWNIKGKNFIALHQLFDAVAAEVSLAVDTIAERIIQLGAVAEGTVRISAKNSRLKEYPIKVTDEVKHVDALTAAIIEFLSSARPLIDDSADLKDAITADMLTGIVSGLDKQVWFISAHNGKS